MEMKGKKFSRNWKIILVFASQKTWSLRKYPGLWLRYERKSFLHEMYFLKLICGEHLTVCIMKSLRPFGFKDHIWKKIKHHLIRIFGGWATIILLFSLFDSHRRISFIENKFFHSYIFMIYSTIIVVIQ